MSDLKEPNVLHLDKGFYKTIDSELKRLHELLYSELLTKEEKDSVYDDIRALTKTLGPYIVNPKNDAKS